MDQEVEDFLEHHGIKGQKWGIRNILRKGNQGDFHRRSGAQKLGLVGGGAVGYLGASYLARNLLANKAIMNKLISNPAASAGASVGVLAGTVGLTVAGVRLTRNLLQTHGKKSLKSLERQPN